MQTFAERLRHFMSLRNVNGKELSSRTGLTEAAISRYLSGSREPKAVVVASIARALDVSADDLLGIEVTEKSDLDNALRLVARNSGSITDAQKRDLINALIG